MNIKSMYSSDSFTTKYSSKNSSEGKKGGHNMSTQMNGSQSNCLMPAVYGGKSAQSPQYGNNIPNKGKSVRENLRALANDKDSTNNARQFGSNSILNNIRDYGNSIKAQRLNSQRTSNNLKKLKYHFKSIASKIIRSKTSASARQVVGQAKREILRLKREKQSGEYNSEEIDAAITHAKAMERIARKKVKHLEEEEMAKATGGPCADRAIDEEEIKDREKEILDKLSNSDSDNKDETETSDYSTGFANNNNSVLYGAFGDYTLSEYSFDDLDIGDMGMLGGYMQTNDMYDNMEELLSDMEEMTTEMMDEFARNMQELLEEMGIDELTDGSIARRGDMDPADLKAMKIKHRNKEMKEMVKADAEYLKAVFDQLEKERNSGNSGINSNVGGGNITPSSGGFAPSVISTNVTVASDVNAASHSSTIDVTL